MGDDCPPVSWQTQCAGTSEALLLVLEGIQGAWVHVCAVCVCVCVYICVYHNLRVFVCVCICMTASWEVHVIQDNGVLPSALSVYGIVTVLSLLSLCVIFEVTVCLSYQ